MCSRWTRTWSTMSFPSARSWSRSQPSDATLVDSSSAVSSKAMNTPFSPCSMPWTRNSVASSVLPHPAAPATSVVRSRGSPPLVMTSRPSMPVGQCWSPFRAVRRGATLRKTSGSLRGHRRGGRGGDGGQGGDMATLLVIIGSTRPGRMAEPVAEWFVHCAKAHGAFDVDVADLQVIDLPLLDEPNHPSRHDYRHEHTKAWSARVDAADAIVLISPEYNTGTSAALKNAIDYLNREWQYKPVGFVTYGGVSAGVRAMEHLVQVASILR